MLAEVGETETATEPEGGGVWFEGEEAEEVPQAARSGARRRNKNGGKLLEREDIRNSLEAGRGGNNWTEEQEKYQGRYQERRKRAQENVESGILRPPT